ncbi:hypothetical protein GCM10010219_18300 [Streptomyces netropsis]|nr:hypothetical protein GCM10010219_18300 [Streptomyces netropsis]
MSRGKVKLSPAEATVRTTGQMAGQSAASATLIFMAPSMTARAAARDRFFARPRGLGGPVMVFLSISRAAVARWTGRLSSFTALTDRKRGM